jgi:hypothetical protein
MKKSDTNTNWAKEMTAGDVLTRGVKCMALVACLAGTVSVANAGSLTSGSSEDFVASEFNGGVYDVGDTFTVTHTLTLPGSGDYGVWDFSNAYVENSDQSLRPTNSGLASFATFKITVPEDMEITSLKWGLTDLGLFGNIPDMEIRYSTDNSNWTTLATYSGNNLGWQGAQSYSTGTIVGSTNEIYIGYVTTSGNPVIKANGTSSYFEVKTAVIPEPSAAALFVGVCALAFMVVRRK